MRSNWPLLAGFLLVWLCFRLQSQKRDRWAMLALGLWLLALALLVLWRG